MQAHNYMKEFTNHDLPKVITQTKRSSRAIYLAMLLLAHPEDDAIVCDASHAEIALLAGVDRQTEVTATRQLETLGLIEIQGEPSDRKPRRKVLL